MMANTVLKIINTYTDTLPDYIKAMPEKGKPTVWLPRKHAIQIERFKGYLNDRCFLMVDHDNCHVRAHELYDLEPNIVVYNPIKPERHQAFWLLRDPVYCQPAARSHAAYRFLRAIEAAHDTKYGCDPHFARYIHKNPLWWLADTDFRHDRSYLLKEFSEVVDLSNYQRVRAGGRFVNSTGRNDTLFNDLRHWAYRHAQEAQSSLGYDAWHKMVITRALSMNSFEVPLERNEALSVAKSVSEFCYYRYQPKKGDYVLTPEFKAAQARRGAIGGKKGSVEDKRRAGSLGGLNGSKEAKAKAGSMSSGGGRPVEATSARSKKPWEEMGISRAWYYKQKSLGVFNLKRVDQNNQACLSVDPP